MSGLHWLPDDPSWRPRLKALRESAASPQAWSEAVALANLRMDAMQTNALDATVRALFGAALPAGLAAKPIRLALLGTCTMTHLHGAIRVAGLRRGTWIDIYENDYGQYLQELADPASALHAFRPDTVLLALDAHHLCLGLSTAQDLEAHLRERTAHIAECWRLLRQSFRCPVIHQTPLPVHPRLIGLNEHRHPASAAHFIDALNRDLRRLAEDTGVDLLALDGRAARDGLAAWFDPDLWYRAKQEVSPAAAPMFGDLLGRLLAAQQGRSFKCLVLDLDNTIWGGVIGDDGMAGIVLGQGSPLGEAYSAFQGYVRDLVRRGVLLAVCSKNDEATALEPFDAHPDMTLRRADIASFVANWTDKPANLKAIATDLNIGLDSLVFVDDNPVERALVRQELPMVAVPETSDEPIASIRALEDGGYFESIAVTEDDRARTAQYQDNRGREAVKASATDLDSYLLSLDMELTVKPFDTIGLRRTVQLINKTNQFNLTTRRYAEEEIRAVMADPGAIGLQLRLTDRFGDNGTIAVVIGELQEDGDVLIDSWLMSCRVLGRQVESATLNLIAARALKLGGRRLIGEYLPTARNGMVKDHYARLGFTLIETRDDGASRWVLDLAGFTPAKSFLTVTEA
ncbi:HAD-IIIC family phosphatase [Sphingomonas sp. dw_22]|uniref:HAD-IIIC family phosphatase n=1 Tax=Sphingomonas sp. dw_22 TaxID=2721175 RepID=UPI001BD46FF9|nr:HAD-IIIC family phosphatase [Sphingomonas sp. dw_22]